MNYNETIEYIHSTPKFSRVLGNDLLRVLLDKLGNPHMGLKYVHIAGTNGKGSTAVMIASILQKAGYKTGLFTSPYIERFNERIKVDGVDIADEELAKITTDVRNIIEEYNCPVSEFALDTAIAFQYFGKTECDIVVLETGLGGRLDATNVIKENEVAVITSVSLDHTQYLGDTIEEITSEKAEIIKPDSDVVLYCDNIDSVKKIIEEKCNCVNSKLHLSQKPEMRYGCLIYEGIGINIPLAGKYQHSNAMTAIKVAEVLRSKGYEISDMNIYEGISDTSWPVRFEYIKDNLIIDGAHNPDAIEKLTDELINLGVPVLPVIAMMSDKAVSECVEIISQKFDSVIVTEIDMPRCMSAEELSELFKEHDVFATAIKDSKEAVKSALETDKTVCVFGSLYLAGEVRKKFKN